MKIMAALATIGLIGLIVVVAVLPKLALGSLIAMYLVPALGH